MPGTSIGSRSKRSRKRGKKGEAKGKADDILRVLEARGFTVPDEVAERVRACRDIATLDSWLTRAVTLKDIAELFG